MRLDLGAEKGLFFYNYNHGGFTVRLLKSRLMLPSTTVVISFKEI